jgi:hypothetical protein
MWGVMPHLGEHGYKTKRGLPLDGTESRGQVEFLELTPRGVFLGAVVASNRWGKTHINVIDAAIQTLPREFIPPWLTPYKILDPAKRDVRMRFIGPDKDRWRDRAILPKLRALLPPAALQGGSFDKAWKQREGILYFADGSWWDFLTHDMELDAFASVELDSARIDEEPTGEIGERQYSETVRGLIDRAGNVRITLTPVKGIGWLKAELADDHDEPLKTEDAWCVTGSIEHNPHISSKGRDRAKKVWAKRGAAEYEARATGRWVHREGLIFPEYRRELEQPPYSTVAGGHLRADRRLRAPDGEPSPRDWKTGEWTVPVFEALDPGINVDHPFALTIAFLNDASTDLYGTYDVLELFYAHKEPNLTVSQQAAIVLDARERFKYRPTFTVIDPSARNRNQESGKELIDLWREHGIYPILGQNSRKLTYEAMHVRLNGEVPPGAPPNPNTARYRVWVSVDQDLGFGDEMSNYRWRKASTRSENAPPPEPIKRNDDEIDTQRYMVVQIPAWRGDHKTPIEDTMPAEARFPQRELMRRHLIAVRKQLRKGGKHGKVGGSFPT